MPELLLDLLNKQEWFVEFDQPCTMKTQRWNAAKDKVIKSTRKAKNKEEIFSHICHLLAYDGIEVTIIFGEKNA